MLWDLLGWIVFGFIAGAIAKCFTPSDEAPGCLMTSVVGILGSIIGGWIGKNIGVGPGEGTVVGLGLAVLGSVVLLLVLRAIRPPPTAY